MRYDTISLLNVGWRNLSHLKCRPESQRLHGPENSKTEFFRLLRGRAASRCMVLAAPSSRRRPELGVSPFPDHLTSLRKPQHAVFQLAKDFEVWVTRTCKVAAFELRLQVEARVQIRFQERADMLWRLLLTIRASFRGSCAGVSLRFLGEPMHIRELQNHKSHRFNLRS